VKKPFLQYFILIAFLIAPALSFSQITPSEPTEKTKPVTTGANNNNQLDSSENDIVFTKRIASPNEIKKLKDRLLTRSVQFQILNDSLCLQTENTERHFLFLDLPSETVGVKVFSNSLQEIKTKIDGATIVQINDSNLKSAKEAKQQFRNSLFDKGTLFSKPPEITFKVRKTNTSDIEEINIPRTTKAHCNVNADFYYEPQTDKPQLKTVNAAWLGDRTDEELDWILAKEIALSVFSDKARTRAQVGNVVGQLFGVALAVATGGIIQPALTGALGIVAGVKSVDQNTLPHASAIMLSAGYKTEQVRQFISNLPKRQDLATGKNIWMGFLIDVNVLRDFEDAMKHYEKQLSLGNPITLTPPSTSSNTNREN
jgi:hypothetical protein